jgi:hypothetical protein
MKSIKDRLSYANVMATIAVFIALGGSAYAATQLKKNSVGAKQLKSGAVTSAKIKNEAVSTEKIKNGAITSSKLANGSVGGAQLKPNSIIGANVQNGSLTGAQINASTLGTVPAATRATSAKEATSAATANKAKEATSAVSANNSEQLGGIGPTGFIQGSGSIVRGFESTSSPGSTLLMTLPNLGEVRVDCFEGKNRVAFFPLVSGSLWFTSGGATGYVNGTEGTQLANQATASLITAQFATTTETATMFISGNPGATCTYAGQAMVQP